MPILAYSLILVVYLRPQIRLRMKQYCYFKSWALPRVYSTHDKLSWAGSFCLSGALVGALKGSRG